ncbi:MAG: hypothetical protein JF614_12435 [Acidobacteria bacterium]|nr:hypothetical protein [Acidobacteriota bacterium]
MPPRRLSSSYFQPGGDGLLIVWDEGNLSGYTGACAGGTADDRSSSSTTSLPPIVASTSGMPEFF